MPETFQVKSPKCKYYKIKFLNFAKDNQHIPLADAAKMFGISYNSAWKWIRQFVKSNSIPKLGLPEGLPSPSALKKACYGLYNETGMVGPNWKSIQQKLSNEYPKLHTMKAETFRKRMTRCTPLSSRKTNRKPVLAEARGFIQRQVFVGCIIYQLLKSGRNVLFFDETIFSPSNYKQTGIGSKALPPLVNNQQFASVRLLFMFNLQGRIAFQVSQTAPKGSDIASFLQQAVPRFLMGQSTDQRTFIVLDNASVHKNKLVRDLTSQFPISLLFTIAGSPFLNLIEDLFLALKRPFKKSFRPNNKSSLEAVLQVIKQEVISKPQDWIFARFVEVLLGKMKAISNINEPLEVPPRNFNAPLLNIDTIAEYREYDRKEFRQSPDQIHTPLTEDISKPLIRINKSRDTPSDTNSLLNGRP